MLPGRTDDQCAKRWRENLDPSISRKPWTEEDDKLLMKTYEKIGKRWKDIASRFQGRPPMHCRNRVQSLVRARRKASAAARKAAHSGLKGTEPVGDKTVIPVESMLAPSDFSGEVRIKIPLPFSPSIEKPINRRFLILRRNMRRLIHPDTSPQLLALAPPSRAKASNNLNTPR